MFERESESMRFERGGKRISDCVRARGTCFWLSYWISGVEIEAIVVS